MEWLHVRVSQKALAKKNSIKSLQDHTEPLKEELGLASIAGPLCIIIIINIITHNSSRCTTIKRESSLTAVGAVRRQR